MNDIPCTPRAVDTPRVVTGDAAGRWWWDAGRLLFRSSLPLVLIAFSMTALDLFIAWMIRAVPFLEIPLVTLSLVSTPVWVAAALVAMRWSDLGPSALRVSLERVRMMIGQIYQLLVPVGAAAAFLIITAPQGARLWDYAAISWSMLIMIGFMAWPNLVGSSVLVAYHEKDPVAARQRMRQGWSLNGWTTAMSSAAVGLLAMCGAASSLPTPMSTFSSAILAQILMAVLYSGYVDIFEKRQPAPGFGRTFE